MMDSTLELIDLGDAKQETRQLYQAFVYEDFMFVWGIFPNKA